MTRYRLTLGALALGFALAVPPAWAAQRPGGEGGGGPHGGGGGGGGGDRPSGGGGGGGNSSSSGSGGDSSVSSGGSTSSSSGGSSGSATSAPAPSRRESAIERAPQRPNASEQRRGGGGGDRSRGGESSTGRAVPRGTSSSSGDATASSSSEGRSRDRATSPRDRAVPAYSRPREGRTVTGRATERVATPVRPGRGGGYYYSPYPYGYYNDPYGYYGSYWYPGYAFGLGYFYYDPFWYGAYAPYGYAGGYSGNYSYREAGSLRLKIKPRDAQVFVDGYYVGNVDSFDGMFQRLTIDSGGHKIEIRAPGYETVQFDVLITPGETVTYKGDLERVQ